MHCGEFDILHQVRGNIEIKQRTEPAIDAPGLLEPFRLDETVYVNGFAWEGNDKTSNPADGAHGQSFKGKIVDTCKEVKPIPEGVDDVRGPSNIIRRFLD